MFTVGDPSLTEWREEVHAFMDDDIGVDYCREKYRDHEYPHQVYDGVVDRGWIGISLPADHGGLGRTQLEIAILLEALGKYGYDFGIPVLVSTTVAENIIRYGTNTQIERFIPKLLDGSIRFSIGVTEPETGSNAAALQTHAERADTEYVITGEKTYQSGANAPGNHINCYVRTDPDAPKREGISVVLVPIDQTGVTLERLPLIARKAAGTYHVTFEDVRVPATNLLGEEGQGWSIMREHLIREHTGMAALMVGNAATVIDTAIAHATRRERFSQPVAEFQAINHRLADMLTEVDAARQLVYRAAAAIDEGNGSRRLTAQAKLKAGETLREVAQHGVQILGGAGLHPANDMERYWREGASATIAGGTSEIQRSIIGRDLIRTD